MKTVALLVPSPARGGLANQVLLLVRLLGRDAKVLLYSPRDRETALGGAAMEEGAVVRNVLPTGSRDAIGFLGLLRAIRADRPDVAHIHLSSPVEAPMLGPVLRLAGGTRVVITEHAPTWAPGAGPARRMAARASLGAAACVLVPSREGARRLTHDYGVSERKLRVVPSAIEPLGYPEEPTGELRAVIDRGAGAPDSRSELPPVLIGTAGVIGDAKDPALFAEIAGVLAGDGVTAVWIGDGPARGRLETEAASTGARLAVTGWQQDPRRLYADLDLFVMTSRAEGCPVVLLEAMASSRPVVAGRVGGIRDVVSDGVSGVLITPGERSGFVTAIRSLLGDPARRREMGRAGRRIVTESFGTETLIAAVREAYGDRS